MGPTKGQSNVICKIATDSATGPFKVSSGLMAQQWCSFALGHLFVQDTDEEEPLAGSQSCSGLVWTAAVRLLQGLKPLEALVSYSEETNSQWKWQNGNMIQQSVHSKPTTGIFQLHALKKKSTRFNLMKGHSSEPLKSYHFFKFTFSRALILSSSFSCDCCSLSVRRSYGDKTFLPAANRLENSYNVNIMHKTCQIIHRPKSITLLFTSK